MIRAGTMRHQVEIWGNIETVDSMGSPVLNLFKLKDARCSINPIVGTEMFVSEAIRNEITHKIGMRFTPDINLSPEYFLKFKGRLFDIVQVLNFNEKNVNVIILCKERLIKEQHILSTPVTFNGVNLTYKGQVVQHGTI